MTDDQRTKILTDLKELKIGDQLRFDLGIHEVIVMLTNKDSFHTGRPRYLVACETCGKLIHAATTGPIEHAIMHGG